ncbi:MAG: 4Fe-4S dicluster domain-containing protein, partial [Clostridia bacterium]|nr:4Fe-4S dicluster domain-containing protein [Clostridia bacterium]
RWASFKDEEKAHNCIECGACETKCPQKINIREDLKTLQKEMDNLK